MNEKTKFPPIPTIPTFAEVVAKKARCEPLTALDGFVRRFDQGGEQSIELAVALQGLLVEACADTAADRAHRQAGHDEIADEHRLRGDAIDKCWGALKALGIEPDGKTGLAGAVGRLAAASQAGQEADEVPGSNCGITADGGYECECGQCGSVAAPPAAPVPEGWISVKDRLPLEGDGTVAVLMDDGSILTAWATYWHGASSAFAQWTHPFDVDDAQVAYWCPVPKPMAL